MESTPGCWQVYSEVQSRIWENYSELEEIHQLTVDTYAVQHPGQISRKATQSVNVHLVSLYFVLEMGVSGETARSRLKQFIESKPDLKWLDPPDFTGTLTIADVRNAKSVEEYKRLVQAWARSVWKVWKEKHQYTIHQHVETM
jgi:hypothetical protein